MVKLQPLAEFRWLAIWLQQSPQHGSWKIMAMSHFILFFLSRVFESHSLVFINFSFLHFTFYMSTCSHVTFCKHNLVIRYREEETIVLCQLYNHLQKQFTSIFTFYNKIVTVTLFIVISRHFLHFLKMPTKDYTSFKMATSHVAFNPCGGLRNKL